MTKQNIIHGMEIYEITCEKCSDKDDMRFTSVTKAMAVARQLAMTLKLEVRVTRVLGMFTEDGKWNDGVTQRRL